MSILYLDIWKCSWNLNQLFSKQISKYENVKVYTELNINIYIYIYIHVYI